MACDGSNLTIAPNLNDPETLWKSNQLGATGNHLHLNALYDVLNRTYIDALVQTASTYQEHRACIQMIERVTYLYLCLAWTFESGNNLKYTFNDLFPDYATSSGDKDFIPRNRSR